MGVKVFLNFNNYNKMQFIFSYKIIYAS